MSERCSQRVAPPTAAASEVKRGHSQGCSFEKPESGKIDSLPEGIPEGVNHTDVFIEAR